MKQTLVQIGWFIRPMTGHALRRGVPVCFINFFLNYVTGKSHIFIGTSPGVGGGGGYGGSNNVQTEQYGTDPKHGHEDFIF